MKPKHFYIAGAMVLLAAFGYLSLRLDDLGDAPFTLALGAMILVFFMATVPPAGLAFYRAEVPADSPIPFSESLAHRIAANLTHTRLWIAILGFFLACAMAFSALTETLPGWQKFEQFSFVVGSLGTVACSLALIVAMISAYSKNKKRFPPDADEARRKELFGDRGIFGVYTEPNDPMVLFISPMNETNIGVNWAHQPGRWWVYGLVIATVVFVAITILVAAMFG